MSNPQSPTPQSASKTTAKATKASAYEAQITPGLKARVRWSRGNQKAESNTLVEFSIDVIDSNNTSIMTINKLQLRSGIDRETKQPVTRIGSMSYEGSKGPIYSNTFFPNSQHDLKQAERLEKFTEELVQAVEAHVADNIRSMEDYEANRNQPNPQLSKLRQTLDNARTLRGN
jgi:hypothetical protein